MNIFLISATILVLDFFSKTWVRIHMEVGREISVTPFFSITHIENTGIAFGLFPGNNWFFITVGVAITSVLMIFVVRKRPRSTLLQWALGLVLGGAWGNLIDRIWFSRVTDFLDFFIGSYHWPAFNVADSAVCIGAILLTIYSFMTPEFLQS